MYARMKEQLATDLEQLRTDGSLQGRVRAHHAAVG